MKVVIAPEKYDLDKDSISVFLAGGIANCPEWQDEVIENMQSYLGDERYEGFVIFNPRRKNFPIDDPNAALEQIRWEYNNIERSDIFSMYFAASESDQPICMYELGRNIVRMQNKYPNDWDERIVISVEDGYKRAQDVIIQTGLACGSKIQIHTCGNAEKLRYYHTEAIMDAFRYLTVNSLLKEDK